MEISVAHSNPSKKQTAQRPTPKVGYRPPNHVSPQNATQITYFGSQSGQKTQPHRGRIQEPETKWETFYSLVPGQIQSESEIYCKRMLCLKVWVVAHSQLPVSVPASASIRGSRYYYYYYYYSYTTYQNKI